MQFADYLARHLGKVLVAGALLVGGNLISAFAQQTDTSSAQQTDNQSFQEQQATYAPVVIEEEEIFKPLAEP